MINWQKFKARKHLKEVRKLKSEGFTAQQIADVLMPNFDNMSEEDKNNIIIELLDRNINQQF